MSPPDAVPSQVGPDRRARGRVLPVVALVLVALVAGHLSGRLGAGHAHGAAPAAAAGAQLYTCSMHPQVIQDHPGTCPICHMELTPVSAGASDGSGITIDPAIVQNMGVRTAPVAKGPLVQDVRVVGYLEEPEPLHRDINLRINGWIERLYADTDGMHIERGAPLFDLYSPELAVAIEEGIAARRQAADAPDDAAAKALLDIARRKLVQYGLEAAQVEALLRADAAPRAVPILAPIDGHLTAKMVYEGAAVKAGDLVLRLASRHRMWIEAQVYEQQMALISDGQPVRATVVAQPGRIFTGKVLFIHPHVDPTTRTALARIELANDDLSLRQGMYATVDILADTYQEALVVPREAVIDTGRRRIAFVALGGGRFQARELTLGQPGQDGTVQVLTGLQAGEAVVTSGQFLLDSESRMREAIAKFGAAPADHAGHAAAAPSPAPAPPRPPAAPLAVPHVDEVVLAYLDLQRRLGARQEAPTPVDAAAVIAAGERAVADAEGEAKAIAEGVLVAARALPGKAIDDQRRAFADLSEAMITLVRRSPPSPAVGASLVLVNCPMAFEEHGANWLQTGDAVTNPYYATQMKRCGSIVERLPTGRR